MSEPTVRVRRVTPDSTLLREIGVLRFEVWVALEPDLARFYPDGCWLDEADTHSEHWIAVDAAENISGAARLTSGLHVAGLPYGEVFTSLTTPQQAPFGVLSRLVVRADARRTGLAREFDLARIARARELGLNTLLAIGEARRASRLAEFGFRQIGPHRELPPWENSENLPLLAQITTGQRL